MNSGRPGVVAPRLAPPDIGELTALDLSTFTDPDGDDIEQAEVRDVDAGEFRWNGRRRIDASVVSGLNASAWRARGLTLTDTRLERLDVLAIAAPEAGWRDVEVRASRIGSLELYDANLRRVSFTGCKLGFVNLRGADIADIVFTDCVLEDLDLMRTTASRVSLTRCRIGHLEVGNAHLGDVDLRGAEFADVSGLEGLRGVTIGYDQLLDLAPILAGRLGVRIEDGRPD